MSRSLFTGSIGFGTGKEALIVKTDTGPGGQATGRRGKLNYHYNALG